MYKELFLYILGIIIAVSISFGADYMRCHSKANALDYGCSYGIFQGCVMIDKEGNKFLLEQLRKMD